MTGWAELIIAQMHIEELEHNAELRYERYCAMEPIESKPMLQARKEALEKWLKAHKLHPPKPSKN